MRRHHHRRCRPGGQRRGRPGSRAARAWRAREPLLELMQGGVLRAGAVEPRRSVEPNGEGQRAGRGQHRRRGGGDHERARVVAAQGRAQRAPGGRRPPRGRSPDRRAAGARRRRSAPTPRRSRRRLGRAAPGRSCPPRASPGGAQREQQHVRAIAHRATRRKPRGRRRPSPRPRSAALADSARLAHPPCALGVAGQLHEGPDKRASSPGATSIPVSPVDHGVRAPAQVGRDHGHPVRHRLEDAHRKRLGAAGESERVGCLEQGGHVRALAQHLHAG